MSWYIKQVGDSSSPKGVEFQVGHYTPDGSWELLAPFIGDAKEAEEGAYRLASFLNALKDYGRSDYGREVAEALGPIGLALVQIEKDLSDPRLRTR